MPFLLRKTITEIYLERIKTSGNQLAFQFKPTYSAPADLFSGPHEWKQVKFRDFHEQTRLISYGLMGLGVRPTDKVAILSNTRIEWPIIDMAILGAKAISVPLYPSCTAADVVQMLNHSESRVLFAESAIQLEKILKAREEKPACLPGLEKIVVIEPQAMRLAVNPRQNIRDVLSLQALRELGKREETKFPERFDEHLLTAGSDDVFTICYTTGTTGQPKGVPLTHGNLISVIEDCIQRMDHRIHPDGEVLLAFLPFSHVLGRVESMIYYAVGGTLAFAESANSLPQDLLDVRPTLLFTVPRIFEKAFNQVQAAVDAENVVSRKVFQWAHHAGRAYHLAIWKKKRPSVRAAARYMLAKKIVFRKITERFGGRLRYAICGGAPLPRGLGEFFEIAGIRILEGYGLTETCAPVALNGPDRPRFGTVGKPLADVSIKIADDGEILIQSKKVFHGYFKDPEETERTLHGGWFHTGDIGYIDREGYLHISDRKKDIIVTSGGKNVAPQKIENLAKIQAPIREIVVYGDGKSYLTALITLDREAVIEHANSQSILFSEYAGLIKNPKIVGWIEKIIDDVNLQLAHYERIRKFMILPQDFSVESGELTSSELKIRRSVIYDRFKSEIDNLYR